MNTIQLEKSAMLKYVRPVFLQQKRGLILGQMLLIFFVFYLDEEFSSTEESRLY